MLPLSVSVEARLRRPPPPLPVLGTVFQLTSLLFNVVVAPRALAIPPPASFAKFPVTTALFRVSVPEKFRIAPPAPATIDPKMLPPVIVTPFKISDPPAGPLIATIRKLLLLPAIVAPLPFTVIGETTTGSPFPPMAMLFRVVSEYVQPPARLIDPPPPALTVFTAATSPALSPQATFTAVAAPAAVAATRAAAAVPTPTTPRRPRCPSTR